MYLMVNNRSLVPLARRQKTQFANINFTIDVGKSSNTIPLSLKYTNK